MSSVCLLVAAAASTYTPPVYRPTGLLHNPLQLRPSRRRSQLLMTELPSSPQGEQTDALLPSEIDEKARSVAAAVGGESAAVQFKATERVRDRLIELGYSEADINSLDPQRAAAIVQASSKKPKSKHDRFELRFTCNVCDAPNAHSISRHAYTKGTVIVTCPGCNATHLIADNLNWIEDDFQTLEQYMANRGTPVTNLVTGGAGVSAAAQAVTPLHDASDQPGDGSQRPEMKPIDGISDEQAVRIREAVQAAKRRRRPDS